MSTTTREVTVENFMDTVKSEVAGLIAVSVIDIASGMTLSSFSSSKTFNPEIASAYNVEVAKQKMRAIKALNINQPIDDILITLKDQIHILKLMESQKFMVYLAADSAKANLGFVRSILRVNTVALEKALL